MPDFGTGRTPRVRVRCNSLGMGVVFLWRKFPKFAFMKKVGMKAMMKRADGSYSQRGLWDNIGAAKGSGKKPTAEMLKQEKKIKAKSK